MKLRIFLLISFLSIFTGKSICQLSEHRDYELNQLNLFVKYINESNNVLSLLYSEVVNNSHDLRDHFESSIYHIPSLTLLDRQTCVFMDAVIRSNSKHHKSQPYIDLMDKLGLLKKEEEKLNEFVIEITGNLKQMDKLSIEILKPHYNTIQNAQTEILKIIYQVKFEKNVCELCTASLDLYNKFNALLNEENFKVSQAQASTLLVKLEKFDFTSWNSISYPQDLLREAITQLIKVTAMISKNGLDKSTRNELLVNYVYKPQGLPQLFNNAFEKFKNQNKTTKYINIAAIPIIL